MILKYHFSRGGNTMNFLNNILTNLDGNSISGLTPELKGLFLYKKFKKENRSIICVTSSIYEANRLYQILLNYTDKVSFFRWMTF